MIISICWTERLTICILADEHMHTDSHGRKETFHATKTVLDAQVSTYKLSLDGFTFVVI